MAETGSHLGQGRRKTARTRKEVRAHNRRGSGQAHAQVCEDSTGDSPPGRATMKNPCMDCGRPADGTRCPTHATRHQRGKDRTQTLRRISEGGRPHYGGGWKRKAALVRATATVCHICGEGPKPNDPWQADHTIPAQWGAGAGPILPAHRSCNIGRGNRTRHEQPKPS